MTAKPSSASFEMGIRTAPHPAATERDSASSFTILMLGDYTGRANRGTSEALHARKLLAIDADNIEQVFAQLEARLKLVIPTLPQGEVELTFSALEDFQPDRLLKSVVALAKLEEARRMLLDPAKARQGEAALQDLLAGGEIKSRNQPTATATTPESDNETMTRLLGGTPPNVKGPVPTASSIEQFIRQTVAPHVSPEPSTGRAGAMAAVEMELTRQLNTILHHPDFQALEAAWRGIDLLVRRIESSEEIRLLVLDLSLAELQADLTQCGSTEQSHLFRLLRDRKPRLLVGNYTFGQSADDLRTLTKLAEVAGQLRAPFVASAANQLAGCDSFARHPDPDDWKEKLPTDVAEIWGALRQSPHAGFVGLAAPRFLARQPYGKSGDAIETFPFEELFGEPAHESFLWGHPATLVACAVIDAIQSGDIELTEFTGGEIGELPVHKFTEDGETVIKSYAEAWFTDRAVERMSAKGILPVIPVKNQNIIQFTGFPSIAIRRSGLFSNLP